MSVMKKFNAFLKRSYTVLVPVLVFIAVSVILIVSIRNAGNARGDEELRAARDSVRRAVVSCYAIEGSYPESYEYLRDHYGVRINEDKYIVHYDIFASNIMPEIEVIPR